MKNIVKSFIYVTFVCVNINVAIIILRVKQFHQTWIHDIYELTKPKMYPVVLSFVLILIDIGLEELTLNYAII